MNMDMNMKKFLKYKNALEQQLHAEVCRIADCLKEGEITSESVELRHQLRELVDLLVHAGECNKLSSSSSSLEPCAYPNCSRGKGLLRHCHMCTKRVCELCKSLLHLVKFHAGACKRSNCRVPRCRVIKEQNRKRALRRERRLRRNEVVASRLNSMRKRMSGGGAGAAEEEEIRVLEGKIRAQEEKVSKLRLRIRGGNEAGRYDGEVMEIEGNEGGGYETKMAEREEQRRRWKERRRVQELEQQLNRMNI